MHLAALDCFACGKYRVASTDAKTRSKSLGQQTHPKPPGKKQ
jgi:hypothetical protein